VISFTGGFHGRTMMALALTGKVAPYKVGFGPFPGDVFHAPYPYEYRGVTTDDSLAAIDDLFHTDIEPSRVAAIVVEPVLGEGGFVVGPKGFLQRLRARCDEHGIMLVADEVQTGIARTGAMFACEHAGIEPDLLTTAKSLGGGFPLAAVTGKAGVMDSTGPSGVGGTYGGNPISVAAALAVLDVVEKEHLVERAVEIGVLVTARLTEMQSRDARIGDVRGLGAMCAIELVRDAATKEPAPDLTRAVLQECARRGLVILSCGTEGNVVRCLVPLTASDEIVNEGLQILDDSLAAH
jgi:4-aminobutyrate aminotransferase/(S)-3-amino-2-methylpropionate transaminase